MTEPNVLILIPTDNYKSYCFGSFFNSLKDLDRTTVPASILISDDTIDNGEYRETVASMGYEVLPVVQTIEAEKRLNALTPPQTLRLRDRLCNARNLLRQEFVNRKEYTHALYLDSDVVAPTDIVPRLVRHDKDIVGGVYWQHMARSTNDPADVGKVDYAPVAYKFQDASTYELWVTKHCPRADNFGATLSMNELYPSRLIPADNTDIQITALGTGVLMLSRKVMEDNWLFRYDIKTAATEDMWFSLDIKKLGYKLHLDTSVNCAHYPKAWPGNLK